MLIRPSSRYKGGGQEVGCIGREKSSWIARPMLDKNTFSGVRHVYVHTAYVVGNVD